MISVNNFGAEYLVLSLLPLMRSNGRIVVISSGFGFTSNIPNIEIRQLFEAETLTVEELDKLLARYVNDVTDGKVEENQWPKWANIMSKIGLVVFVKILAR